MPSTKPQPRQQQRRAPGAKGGSVVAGTGACPGIAAPRQLTGHNAAEQSAPVGENFAPAPPEGATPTLLSWKPWGHFVQPVHASNVKQRNHIDSYHTGGLLKIHRHERIRLET